jgi:hypothetical protein
VSFEGGGHVDSSGPGMYTSRLIRKMVGYDRRWCERIAQPLLPEALLNMVAEWDSV